ncbi:MAG TPA: CinA family nicotinamide mononucleotide deamidase-related protein [Gaiellaceae bacterium]|nr:CinA family nicotinamide mononucleotide deamidase-related protein [Gaiellaceae bacterium]
MSRPRAAIVVTGSELTRGGRQDENGPFLARELAERGLEPERIVVVGDRPEELEAALAEGLRSDLLVTSGGLGPTHDDRTVEVLAKIAGRGVVVDEDLERQIEAFSRELAARYRRSYADFEEGVRKQASLPEGAEVLGLAGTAPGLVLEVDGAVAVVLPGPPGELRRLWERAVESAPVRGVLTRARAPERRVLRFYGVSESAVARALAEAGGEPEGVEATVCAHGGEIEVLLQGAGEGLADALRASLAPFLFAEDERTVEELVLEAARAADLTVGTAESCTGGLVAVQLTRVPGSSDVFRGGIVAYENDVKVGQLDVPEETLAEHGAVSAATAAAMAAGVRATLGVDVAVSVTGIAGPGGGTAEKPVGLVFLHAEGPDGSDALELRLHGGREQIRRRATVAALHLLRRLLTQSRDEGT